MARCLALLNPYFEKETPQAVREIEAEDWAASLHEFPRWAIERAARWWKGPANQYRHRRPLEGDIAARCGIEMDAVRAARVHLRRTEWQPDEPEQEREPPTPEEQAERAKAADKMTQEFLARHKNVDERPTEGA